MTERKPFVPEQRMRKESKKVDSRKGRRDDLHKREVKVIICELTKCI